MLRGDCAKKVQICVKVIELEFSQKVGSNLGMSISWLLLVTGHSIEDVKAPKSRILCKYVYKHRRSFESNVYIYLVKLQLSVQGS